MNSETRLRVNENGRVVIPASFRKALGIHVGDEIVLRIEDDELRITTLKRRIERAQRLVRRHVNGRRARYGGCGEEKEAAELNFGDAGLSHRHAQLICAHLTMRDAKG